MFSYIAFKWLCPPYASSDQAKEQVALVSIRPEEFIKDESEILKESFPIVFILDSLISIRWGSTFFQKYRSRKNQLLKKIFVKGIEFVYESSKS